jgi:hypothetical protein
MSDLDQGMFGDSPDDEGVFGFLSKYQDKYRRQFQVFADKVTPFSKGRWGFFVGLVLLFFLRIYLAAVSLLLSVL